MKQMEYDCKFISNWNWNALQLQRQWRLLPRASCWCPPFLFPLDRLSPLTQVPLSSKPLSSSLVRSPWIFPFATHNTNMHKVDMFEFLKPLFPLLINMKQATGDTTDQPLSFKYHITSRKDATSSVYHVLCCTCSYLFNDLSVIYEHLLVLYVSAHQPWLYLISKPLRSKQQKY